MKKRIVIFLLVILLLVFLLKTKLTAYSLNSDENAYFYMGMLVSEGSMPYRDFFFSHPPLHIFVNALIFKLFGFNLFLLKLVPFSATLITAYFIFKLVNERCNEKTALFAAALFLFQYSILRISTQSVGINLALMFTVIAAYFALNKKNVTSGVLFGLASITGLYSLVAFALVSAICFFNDRKALFKLVLGFSAVFLPVNLLFFALSPDFLTQVYLYHLMKPAAGYSSFSVLLAVLKLNPFLFLSAALILLSPQRRKLKAVWLMAAAYILFFTVIPRTFIFYFVFAFPFLAVIGAVAFADITRRRTRHVTAALLVFILASGSYAVINFERDYKPAGQERIAGLAELVEKDSYSHDTIFGDIYMVPLLALMTGRRIAANIIDTNRMRFESVTDINDIITKLSEAKPAFVILEESRDLAYSDEFTTRYLNVNCRLSDRMSISSDLYYIFRCS